MARHTLKCWPPYWGQIARGEKRVELRKGDRAYHVGDRIELLEWVPDHRDRDVVPVPGSYTGRACEVVVTHILGGTTEAEGFGLQPGYVALSLELAVVWHGLAKAVR